MYELQGKRPATIVDTRLTLVAPYHQKADLAAAVRKQAARGQVRPVDARPHWNATAGQWEQRVIELRAPAPAWRGPLLFVLAVLFALMLLLGLAWWVLVSLAALPLGILCVAAMALLAWALRSGRSSSVTVINNTRVK